MSATTKTLRCLIVEDVEDDALLLLRQLRTGGYDVTWERVDTPEAMRAALARQPWDVVLSDYRMPRFSGLAALEILRESGIDLPFIIVSGTIGEEVAVAAMKAGVDDYLIKGELAHLTVAVERELRNAATRRERKVAEEALRRNEARQRAMVANIGDVIVIIDQDGINRYKSPNIEKWFGWRPEDVVGVSALGNVHPEDKPHAQKFIGELLSAPNAMGTTECRYRCKDGGYKWISFTGINLLHDPNIQGLLGNYHDITGRKEAEVERAKLETQFQQAQKMEAVGSLAGGVAHDFNNMLQAILGNVDLALEGVPSDSPTGEGLREIRKCAERSADLTRQLLAFARRQTIAPKVLDLNVTVNDLLKMLRRLIGEDIDLAWLPERDLGLVKVDPTQVDQILANLCVNARDAIDGVGKVTIETANAAFDAAYCVDHPGYLSGEYARLNVSDNGCGMDKATQAQIFEPFFTTKGKGAGTGLGLATVYGIVKQNHGFITVYSELGHGTTFTVYLPRHAGQATATGTTIVAEMPKSSGETVLLVEDEPAVRGIARMILERLGYTVLAASTPGEAIRLTETHVGAIHLLITDVVMPEMNGRDLNHRLLALRPKLKCLFMSGYTADVIGHHGVLEAGVNFIQKPFSMGDLAAKVRMTLGDSSPQPGDFK